MNITEKNVQYRTAYGVYAVNYTLSIDILGDKVYITALDRVSRNGTCVSLTKAETQEIVDKLQDWLVKNNRSNC